MLFPSAFPLAALLATSALANPIQQATSSRSSSPSPEERRSQNNVLTPFVLESLRIFTENNRQYIAFWVSDPDFSPYYRGFCSALIDNTDGELAESDTVEERSWRPLRPSSEDGASTPSPRVDRLAFPSSSDVNINIEDMYGPPSLMDEEGYIECTNGYWFKAMGDVVPEDGNDRFELSVKHILDRENTKGIATGDKRIFGDVIVECRRKAPGSDDLICLPIGSSKFTFGIAGDDVGSEDSTPDAEEAEAGSYPAPDEGTFIDEAIDTPSDDDTEGF